ncbi:MAG: hypothetical protein ABH834_06230 [Candidatus Altiarchaeota archaeon]
MAKRKVKPQIEIPQQPRRNVLSDFLAGDGVGRNPLLDETVDFTTRYNALPDGKDAVPRALEGVERRIPCEALPEVSPSIVVPVLPDDVVRTFNERKERGFPNRGLGVLVLRSHHGVSFAEVLTPSAEESPLEVAYDAGEVCDMLRGTRVDAVIPVFNMNPVAGDIRELIGFRSRIREELGADTPVYVAGVHNISEAGASAKIFAVHPDADDADVIAQLDRCDGIVEDFRTRWNASTHNMQGTKLNTPRPGESAANIFERIAWERKRFVQGYYDASFGRDQDSGSIPGKLDQSLASLRHMEGGSLSQRTDQVLAFIAQSSISQTGVNNLLFKPNLLVSVRAPLDEIGRVTDLPSFAEGEAERLVVNVGGDVAEGVGLAFDERSGYRCLGWMLSHVRDGGRVLEFSRPGIHSESEYSSDFDESGVVGRLGAGLEDARVFMVYAGTPTAADFVNYRNAAARIREQSGEVPVYLASAVQLSPYEAVFRACRVNPQAPSEGVEDMLRLAQIIDDDYMARSGLEASEISQRTRVKPSSEQVYGIMTARADSAAAYVEARLGDTYLAGKVREHVVGLADYLRAGKGGQLELSDEVTVSYEAVVDVAQATFRKVMIDSHAVEEVELVGADGTELSFIPVGPNGIHHRDVYRLLTGGREDAPAAVRTYSAVAMRYDANPVFLKPLADDAFSYQAETVSDETVGNLMDRAEEVNLLLSRRLAHSERTDRSVCAVLARGVEKERACILEEERLPPRVNEPAAVKSVLESIYGGELSQASVLEDVRARLSENVEAITGRTVEHLLNHEPSLAVHCDLLAGAVSGAVAGACGQLEREAAQADGLARMSNKDLTTRFGGKTKRARKAFNPDTVREAARQEAQDKRHAVESVSQRAVALQPVDDASLIRAEIVSEAIEAFKQGGEGVRLEDVTALARDFGREDLLEAEFGTPEQLAAKLKAEAEKAEAGKKRLVAGMAETLSGGTSELRSRRDVLMDRIRGFVGGERLEGVESLDAAVEVAERVADERRKDAEATALVTEMAGGDFNTFHEHYGKGSAEEDIAELRELPLAEMKRLCDDYGLAKSEMTLLFWTLREMGNSDVTVAGVRSAVEHLSDVVDQPIQVAAASMRVPEDAHIFLGESEYGGVDGRPLHGLLLSIDHLDSITDAGLSAWTEGFVENMQSAQRRGELDFDEALADGWSATCSRLGGARYADMISGDARKKKDIAREVLRIDGEAGQNGARETIKQLSALVGEQADPMGLMHHMRRQILAVEEAGVSDGDVPNLARDYILAEKTSELLGERTEAGSGLTDMALEVSQLSETRMNAQQKQEFDTLVDTYTRIVEML